jgi:hypothetical protein
VAAETEGGTTLRLSRREYAELVSTLISLRGLGSELEEVLSGSTAADGAKKIVSSVDRLLEIVGYPGES